MLDTGSPLDMAVCISAGLLSEIWVVKAPSQSDVEFDVSRAIPLADRLTVVLWGPVFCNMNGEPGSEHDCASVKFAQFVLFTPGPNCVRSKWRLGFPLNVMKSRTIEGPPETRSLIVPCTAGRRVPVEYVTLVNVPVSTQPVPPPTGRVKSMFVPDTSTPPPVQFATVRVPETAADPVVRKERNAATVTAYLETPFFCIRFLLRRIIAHTYTQGNPKLTGA